MDGDSIDMAAAEYEFCSGPVCGRCYEAFCKHCLSPEETQRILDSDCIDGTSPAQLDLPLDL